MSRPDDPRIPLSSHLLGFGPMLPLIAAAFGAWFMPPPWPFLAIQYAIAWAALVLAFIGGVRRGFGFGNQGASTAVEITAAGAYLGLAALALLVPHAATALALLAAGYALAALLDARAARRGDAPAHFARLRPPQLLLGCAGLGSCWAWMQS